MNAVARAERRQEANPNLLPPFQKGENGRPRGPDRKPRQVARLAFSRALVAVKTREGRAVSGLDDLTLGLREIYGDHNHRYFLGVVTLTKELYDDAPDGGSGHITRFIFASEVEEEMKRRGLPTPAQRKAPEASPGPLAGMEELEEPGG